jgi:hypothetical protein
VREYIAMPADVLSIDGFKGFFLLRLNSAKIQQHRAAFLQATIGSVQGKRCSFWTSPARCRHLLLCEGAATLVFLVRTCSIKLSSPRMLRSRGNAERALLEFLRAYLSAKRR